MSNTRVEPDKKKIPMIVTVQKRIIKMAKETAAKNNVSLSSYVESIIIKDLDI